MEQKDEFKGENRYVWAFNSLLVLYCCSDKYNIYMYIET